MITSGDFDKLDCHTQAIACFTNTAFEQRPHAELLAYCANVGACVVKLKGGGPGCDAKAINARKGVNEFVGQTFTQVIPAKSRETPMTSRSVYRYSSDITTD